MKTTTNKAKGIRVQTTVKAGGLTWNHNARKPGIRIRTAVKGGLLLPAVQSCRQAANHNASKAKR